MKPDLHTSLVVDYLPITIYEFSHILDHLLKKYEYDIILSGNGMESYGRIYLSRHPFISDRNHLDIYCSF